MSFELFESDNYQNPWAVGGAMHRRLPWVQESMNHGWGVGNDYFQPKTKEQIRKEALLQLAVLAVAVAAPAVLGAVGGAGAAGAAGAGGTGAGLGASAQAATGAITQGSVAGAAASSAGAAAASSALGISLGAGAAAYAALQPFLNPQNVQAIKAAAGLGVDALGNLLQNQPPNGRPSFVYEPGTQDDHVEDFPFAHPTGNRPSREPARLLTAIVDRLDGIAGFRQLGERIAREKEGEKSPLTMQRLSRDARVRGMLAELAVEVVKELGSGNPWEVGKAVWDKEEHPSSDEHTCQNQEDQIEGEFIRLFPYDPKYRRSVETADLYKYHDATDELAIMEVASEPDPERKLDLIFKYYEDISSRGKTDQGWHIAAKHLDHFLYAPAREDGTAEDMIVDPQFIFQFQRARQSAMRALGYVFLGARNKGKKPGLIEYAGKLSIGEKTLVKDHWDAYVSYPTKTLLGVYTHETDDRDLWDELAYAMGAFTMALSHTTTLEKVSPATTRFSGKVSFLVQDPYDWDVDQDVSDASDLIAVQDKWAQRLVDAKRAHTFMMKSGVDMEYYGEIINGRLCSIYFKNVRNKF